jgi:hypothetical protein
MGQSSSAEAVVYTIRVFHAEDTRLHPNLPRLPEALVEA